MAEKKKAVQINPLDITESLGYTTYRRDSRKPWTRDEDMLLGTLMNEKLVELGYPDGINSLSSSSWEEHSVDLPQRINWDMISEKLKTRKPKDCRKRWTNSLDPTLKKGKWTAEEDQKLLASFENHGSSWQKISLDIPGRTDDQCAKRYIEVLDPNTKDRLRPWSLEEDLSLIKKVKAYGTKWRTISLEMHSRPSLTCRNRWRKIVTDVVRGKATPDIKKEIDSIQGGLSKVAEISENLQSKNAKKEKTYEDIDEESNQETDEINEGSVEPLTQRQEPSNRQQAHNNNYQNHQKRTSQSHNSLMTGVNSVTSPPFGLPSQEPKPATTDVDWKYTLKDTSGLSISSGAISTTDLARQLIETAKKNDLKISIHQHIHHHYAPTPTHGKGQSPEDSGSNLSGAQNDEHMPNRYSHFNYLPAMVRPQLESSSLESKESDLARLLNPHTNQHHQQQQHTRQQLQQQQQQHSSQSQQQYQSTANKRRHSNSSSNSRKRSHPMQDPFSHEELDDELDFWETMRSLSQVVNSTSSLNNNRVEYHEVNAPGSSSNNEAGRAPQNVNGESGGAGSESNGDSKKSSKKDRFGNFFYSSLAEEDLEDDLNDLKGIILPFNPS